MKQYLNSDQTAKLIEMGFEKPKGWYVDGVTNHIKLYVNIDENPMMFNYSIGELIEMLMTIKGVKISFEAMYGERLTLIVKRLVGDKWDILYGNVGKESVDLLFDTIVKLKKEKIL